MAHYGLEAIPPSKSESKDENKSSVLSVDDEHKKEEEIEDIFHDDGELGDLYGLENDDANDKADDGNQSGLSSMEYNY